MLSRNIFQWNLPVLKTFIATTLSSVLSLTHSFFLAFNVEFMLNLKKKITLVLCFMKLHPKALTSVFFSNILKVSITLFLLNTFQCWRGMPAYYSFAAVLYY